jgi:argininosuccinate synthase
MTGAVSAARATVTIEAPAAVVLHEAHRALQRSVTTPEIDRRLTDRSLDYVELLATGGWFTRQRVDGDAFIASVQKHVTGTARLKLFKGRSEVVECRSPFALSHTQATPRAADAAASRS